MYKTEQLYGENDIVNFLNENNIKREDIVGLFPGLNIDTHVLVYYIHDEVDKPDEGNDVETIKKSEVKEILETLMKDNEDNFTTLPNEGYERKYALGYAEGVHDGLLDAMNKLGIETEEEYYN